MIANRQRGNGVQAGGGGRTALFSSPWNFGTGTSDTVLRNGTTWDDKDGGTLDAAIVVSAGRMPTAYVARVNYRNSLDYGWVQKYTVRPSSLSVGQFICYRYGMYVDIPDGEGAKGWAGNHPIEWAAVAGGGSDSTNKIATLWGNSGTAGQVIVAIEQTGVAFPYNYLSLGSAGGGDPATIAKATLWIFEHKLTKAGTNSYNHDIRVRNSGGTITYSTGDGLNNIYGWGGLQFGSGGRNQGLAIDDVAVNRFRVFKNGGVDHSTDVYTYYGMVAATDDDWVGATDFLS